MKNFPDKLGAPDIKISGLELWIHGNAYPDMNDYWDGNWMSCTARCIAQNACVWVSGTFLHLPELKHLLNTSEKLYNEVDPLCH